MRQVVNVAIWRKNLRNLTRNSWNCGFRRVTLFFGTTGCAAVVRASCPTLASLIVKVKTKHWPKFREKPVSNHCNSSLVFANCAWYLASGFDTCPLAHQLEEILGQFSGNLTLFFGDYICYISEFATILEFAVQTLEMTITYLKWVHWIYWNYENVNEISILMSNSILYRKVKGNLSMIIVIDITCMK